MSSEHRILILCGPRATHRNTCATLISAGLNVVGICIADQRKFGLPTRTVSRGLKRAGWRATASRMAARLLYAIENHSQDQRQFQQLFDDPHNRSIVDRWSGPIHQTNDYSSPDTLAWMRRLTPDLLAVHTPYWVGKKVREVPSTGIVLGGHPGITPLYRGAHSALQAVLRGRPEDVGCTVFILDEGADTGDIVAQERIPPEPGDSFVSLGWKGMIRIGQMQAEILTKWSEGGPIPRRPVTAPADSYFDNPTLAEYLHYRKEARRVGLR